MDALEACPNAPRELWSGDASEASQWQLSALHPRPIGRRQIWGRTESARMCRRWRWTDIVTDTRLDWPNGHTWPTYSRLPLQHPRRCSLNYSYNTMYYIQSMIPPERKNSMIVIIHICHQEGPHRTSSCEWPGDKTGVDPTLKHVKATVGPPRLIFRWKAINQSWATFGINVVSWLELMGGELRNLLIFN